MVAALGAVLVLATACASGPSATAGTVTIGGVRSSSTATHTQPTNSLVEETYDKWDFTAIRPVRWESYPYEFLSPEEPTIGYLSTDTVRNPCRSTVNRAPCSPRDLLTRLSSDGVLITWRMAGIPFQHVLSEFPGAPLRVGGSPARLDKSGPATGDCQDLGGAVQIVGTVQFPHDGANFLQMHACIGPDAGKGAELDADALFRSVDFTG